MSSSATSGRSRSALVKSVYIADGWFRDELSLVVAGVSMAALGLHVLSDRRTAASGLLAQSGRAQR